MIYPLQTLRPIASQLRSRTQSDTDDDISWRYRLERAVMDIPLSVGELASPTVPMTKLIFLAGMWRNYLTMCSLTSRDNRFVVKWAMWPDRPL